MGIHEREVRWEGWEGKSDNSVRMKTKYFTHFTIESVPKELQQHPGICLRATGLSGVQDGAVSALLHLLLHDLCQSSRPPDKKRWKKIVTCVICPEIKHIQTDLAF